MGEKTLMTSRRRRPRRLTENGRELVLVIAKGYPPTTGGVERYSEQVVAAYQQKGLQPVVLTQTEGPSGWSVRENPAGSYAIWNAGPGSQPVTFVRMLRETIRLRCSTSIPRVHVTTWRVGLVARAALRRATTVVTIHGREVLNLPWFLKPFMVGVLTNADVALAVSAATEAAARTELGRQRPRGRWHVAFNGLTYAGTPKAVRGIGAGSLVRLLSLCRLVPRKNIAACLESLAALRSEGIDQFEYIIAGDGPIKRELEEQAARLGLADRVRFLGYVPDERIPELYEWADIFLHPHTHVGEGRDFEGFGLVIADAMAFGCAVVVGDVGGPRELVFHLENGLLVDGGDQRALTGAIRILVTDPELRQRLGATARAQAPERFSWADHVQPAVDAFAARAGQQ
jgi:phosphatidyl-myo-inositol dimannoside synthase